MSAADSATSQVKAHSRGFARVYENLGLRAKIVSIVIAFALVSSAVTAVTLTSMATATTNTREVEALQNTVAAPIGVVHQEEIKARMLIALYAAMPTDSASEQQVWEDKIAGTDADLAAAVASYEAGIAGMGSLTSTLGGESWQAFKAAWEAWTSARDSAMAPAAADSDQAGFEAAFAAAQADLDVAIDSLEVEEKLVAQVAVDLADSAKASSTLSTYIALGTFVVGLVLVVLLALWAATILRRQVANVRRVADALAEGDFTALSGVESKDEIGQMGAALDSATATLRATMAQVAGSANDVSAAAQALSAGNAQVAAGANEVSARADQVATAAGEVSRNLTGVSSGSEEMTASIREIAHSTEEAARVGQQAANAAQSANDQIGRLDASSQEIGAVVKTITAIASQTNLLALNATIEAARAGEAGKGFAVVAGEVGELARETAHATEDISKRVETIQADAQGAVAAIAQIAEIVQRINEYQSTIASAIEQQTATTNEMGRNVSDAATGSEDIATSIETVAQSAAASSQVLGTVTESVADLDKLAKELRDRVGSFRY